MTLQEATNKYRAEALEALEEFANEDPSGEHWIYLDSLRGRLLMLAELHGEETETAKELKELEQKIMHIV